MMPHIERSEPSGQVHRPYGDLDGVNAEQLEFGPHDPYQVKHKPASVSNPENRRSCGHYIHATVCSPAIKESPSDR